MSDCDVCCETFNRQNHKKVECPFCDFVTCRKCVQTYLVDTTNDPHCMSCKNAWNREFVDNSCTKVWRNKTLKTHRETILLEREKCLLPETQILVTRVREKRSTINLIRECQQEIKRQRQLQRELEDRLYMLNHNPEQIEDNEGGKRTFVRKCPVDDCRGFLSSQWKCDICENKICKACNEIKTDGHVCDPANVETVNLLAKDTKPCPKCGTFIFKISGCSQMWCPSCHVAFNWNTLRIETGIIHNPHYYEFQRHTGTEGRNLGDIPCGGMPDMREMVNFMNPNLFNNLNYGRPRGEDLTDSEKKIYNTHRVVSHVQHFAIPFEYRIPDNNDSDLRVKYLMNELSENEWKKILQQREKKREKCRDVTNILTMFSDTMADLFRQFVNHEIKTEQFMELTERLRRYTNTTLENIHKRYNCVTPYITETWRYTSKNHKGDITVIT